jgi:hypothetical protein
MIAALREKIEILAREIEDRDRPADPDRFLQVDRELDAAISSSKRDVLKSQLADDDGRIQEVSIAIRDASSRLAEAGGLLAHRVAHGAQKIHDDEKVTAIIAACLANYGTAVKWCATAHGRPREEHFAALHALYRLAESLGLAHAGAVLEREGVARSFSPEAHYLRSLMLPMICTGNMGRQELEIADSWLWTWVREYRLSRHAEPGEPGLWVDIRGADGARLARSSPCGEDVRHLVVSRMKEQLAEVISGFRAGHIYPGFGLSSEFRLEAHVRVIEIVEGMWEGFDRAPRVGSISLDHGGRRVEAFAGLPEILGRAFAKQDRDDGDPAMHLAVVPRTSPGPRSAQRMSANVQEMATRWARVREEWDCGARLSVESAQWENHSQGDLVAIRTEGGEFPCVGAIERKFLASEGGSRITVNWIGREPRRVTLRPCAPDASAEEVQAIYLPGQDASGQLDSLVLSQSQYTRCSIYDLELGGSTFRIRLNRVRTQGRGWAMAGYEIQGMSDSLTAAQGS